MFRQNKPDIFHLIKINDWEGLRFALTENPELIYETTPSGNTPLHFLYALDLEGTPEANWVLDHDPKYFATATNHQGETALDVRDKIERIFIAIREPKEETIDRYRKMLLGINATSARAVANYLTQLTGKSPVNHDHIFAKAFHDEIDQLLRIKKRAIAYIDALSTYAEEDINDEDALIIFTLISYLNLRLQLRNDEKKLNAVLLKERVNEHRKSLYQRNYSYILERIKVNNMESLYNAIYTHHIPDEELEKYITANYPEHLHSFLNNKESFTYFIKQYQSFRKEEEDYLKAANKIAGKKQIFENLEQRLAEAKEDFIAFLQNTLENKDAESKTWLLSILLSPASINKFNLNSGTDYYYAQELQTLFSHERVLDQVARQIHQKTLNNLVYQWLDQIPTTAFDQDLTFFARLHAIGKQADNIEQSMPHISALTSLVVALNAGSTDENEFIYQWLENNFNLNREDVNPEQIDTILAAIVGETILDEATRSFQNRIKQEIIRMHNLNEAFSPFAYRGYDTGMKREDRVRLMQRSVALNPTERKVSVNLGGEKAKDEQSANLTITSLTSSEQLGSAESGWVNYHTGFDDNISFTELLNCAAYYASDQGCISIACNTIGIDLDLYLMNVMNQEISSQFEIKGDLRERAFKNLGLESYVCNFQINRITSMDEENPKFIRYEISDPIFSDDFKKGLLALSTPKDEQGFYMIPFFLINACMNLAENNGKQFYIEVGAPYQPAVLRLIEKIGDKENVIFSTDNEYNSPHYLDKIRHQHVFNYVFSELSHLHPRDHASFTAYMADSQRQLGNQFPREAQETRNDEVNRVRWRSKGVAGVYSDTLFAPTTQQGKEQDKGKEKEKEKGKEKDHTSSSGKKR